jgi:hypothetical protein
MIPPRSGLVLIGRATAFRRRFLDHFADAMERYCFHRDAYADWVESLRRGGYPFPRERRETRAHPGTASEQEGQGHRSAPSPVVFLASMMAPRATRRGPRLRIADPGDEECAGRTRCAFPCDGRLEGIELLDLPMRTDPFPFDPGRYDADFRSLRSACARAAGVIMVYDDSTAAQRLRVGDLERLALRRTAWWIRTSPGGESVPIAFVEVSNEAEVQRPSSGTIVPREHEAGRERSEHWARFACSVPDPDHEGDREALARRWEEILRPIHMCVDGMIANERCRRDDARAERALSVVRPDLDLADPARIRFTG